MAAPVGVTLSPGAPSSARNAKPASRSRGGRRRHRQKPVGRAHRASSERQRPAMPARPREKIDDGGRADDVGHGVPIRQFMKMYSLDRNTMYRCFCLGQQRQDAESVVAIRCRERRLGEPSANIGVSTAGGGCASLEDKPRCGKATAAALHERDFAALREAAVPNRAQHRRQRVLAMRRAPRR